MGESFISSRNALTGSWAQPVSYSVGNRRFFLGEKWPVLETDQSLQSSAEVKNERSYIFRLLYAFMASVGTALLSFFPWTFSS